VARVRGHRGGETAAAYFSLIANYLRHELDPFANLWDLSTRLPALLVGRPDQYEMRVLLPDR